MVNAYDIIIIGAGHNGLTAAIILARGGRRVLVLERRGTAGGLAAAEEFHPGYHSAGVLHDTTAVRPAVVRRLGLAACGLEYETASPPILIPQIDGPGLLLHHDAAAAEPHIAAHRPDDARRYRRYRDFVRRGGVVLRQVLDRPPPDPAAGSVTGWWPLLQSAAALRRLGQRDMMALLRAGPMSAADWLDEWFESDVLKAALAGPAIYGTFLGPRSPGSASNLWIADAVTSPAVRGGGPALIEALLRAATSAGVTVRTAAAVRQIRVADGRVGGVLLADGTPIESLVVAASCDPRHTLIDLMPPGAVNPQWDGRMRSFRARGTTAKAYLALDRPLTFACRPEHSVERARIGEHLDELERAFDAVKYRRWSSQPIFDIQVPTVHHPALAPAGHCVVSIDVHFVPFDLDGGWNDQRRTELQDVVLHRLEQYAPQLRQSLVACTLLTPHDLQERYGLSGGHIHHGEHALDQRLIRPALECARYATPIGGLYLCGSGSHPGGGLTCMPGALAAQVIARDLGRGRFAAGGPR